uniref:YqaJ viral recombinase domain-containing protein n=1 Tax=viral metagenome TaxID=1070528 RepID=A0A6C0KXZ8_9ZZZZ
MRLSDLKPLKCILHTIIPEEPPKYVIKDNYEIEFLETCLELISDYIDENPTAISEPEFEEDMFDDIKELFTIHFYGDPFFNDNAEEEIDEIIDIAFSMFYEQIMPRRFQNGTSYEIIRSEKQIKNLEEKIKALSELEQPEQRTPEWYEYRHNLITASNAYKAFENQTVQNQLIYEKCQPLFVPQSDSSEFTLVNTNTTLHWGQKYEPLSVMIYEDKYKTKVGDFGCIKHKQFSFLGASPDGINIDKNSQRYGRMLEIKNIVNREINGNPKKEYWVQMQLQMETCDLDECDFLETKFVEYVDRDAFNQDSDEEDVCISKNGEIKGIIIQFITKEGKPYYEYKSLDLINKNEIEEWEEKTLQYYQSEEYNYTYVKFIYWKLEEISCALVLRNKKWFQDNIGQIQNIWSIIEKERNIDHSHRAPNKRVKKQTEIEPNHIFKPILNVIKIRTESFDETNAIMK